MIHDVKVAVAHLGARMHYAVPRILHSVGILHKLYTDISAHGKLGKVFGHIPSSHRPAAMSRLLGRVTGSIPKRKVTTFPFFGLVYVLACKVALSQSMRTKVWLWGGQKFAREVAQELDFDKVSAVYAYQSAALEILQHARDAGSLAIMEQTNAPRRIVMDLRREEYQRSPSWSRGFNNPYELDYSKRESEEWRSADVILCGSDFVRKGIAKCGGPVEKCLVVPYGVDSRFNVASPPKQREGSKLRVLTVGSVGLRKGSPYVLRAAMRCEKETTFRMVGSVNVSGEAVAELREHVEVVGEVPRSKIYQHYAWADVFLLPSICEGSATATYEALAAGLPVICTPNTGSIVRDGKDGYIVPIRDHEAIARCIIRLADNDRLRQTMSENAQKRYEQTGSFNAYARRLLKVISEASGMLS